VNYLYAGALRPVSTRAELLAEIARMGETLVPRISAIPTSGRQGAGVAPR
jgi:hypothetical protein